MIEILREQNFRRLFGAHIVALVGTGLTTVALALLAYDLAGDRAGAVLGTALAIKMLVYVLLAPVSAALVPTEHRKTVLIVLDLIRCGVAMLLPFVDAIWQIYVLIAVLQSASACFTPLFQSVIPQILTDERKYTRALSLSRLAYDLESLLSPALAAALLTVVSFHGLFVGTSIGFLLSALLVLATAFPAVPTATAGGGPYARAMRGMRIYLRTPRLRGLLMLNLCAAAGGAMVFVNTVVIVRTHLHGGEHEVAWLLAAFGSGSMSVALVLPRLLDRIPDRRVMLTSAASMTVSLVGGSAYWWLTGGRPAWIPVAGLWLVLGISYAGLVTPGGRLLRRSGSEADLPFLFAAQFSLSHVCWLLAYPLAGWAGARFGLGVAWLSLSSVAVTGLLIAWRTWPRHDPDAVEHAHPELPDEHPHLAEHQSSAKKHIHAYMIDDLHGRWPR
jgi:MFS family permease